MMRLFNQYILKLLLIGAVILGGCRAGGDNPGLEYAPQMYHSVPYEPLTQITDEGIPSGIISSWYYITNSLPYNDYNGKVPMNVKKPVEGTVARQNFRSVTRSNVNFKDQPIFIYDLPKDSLAVASKIESPLPKTEKIVKEGKHLYQAYCSHCHGDQGDGKGKVGEVYGGVANLKARAYLNLTEGHIFHVVTHGKGRMWPHKSQLNAEERWKVARFVKELQK